VLVTGVSRTVAASVAIALARHPAVDHVVGLDAAVSRSGAMAAAGVQLIRADLRSTTVVRVVRTSEVDTVVHMGVVTAPRAVGGAVPMKEINVMGTLHLLAGCQQVPGLRRVVVRSSAGVYGAGPTDPALLTEDTEPSRPPRRGWARDCVDVEASVRSFERRRRDVTVTVLRCAHAIGPSLRTGFTDLFAMPAVPAVLGRDGRLQFVHLEDVVGAAVAAALGDVTGEVNVAGSGVITVSQAAALARRPIVWLPPAALSRLRRLPGATGAPDLSDDDIAVLAHGRVLDTTRMRRDLGYTCRWTTRTAFEDFVAGRRLRETGSRPVLRELTRLSAAMATAAATGPSHSGGAVPDGAPPAGREAGRRPGSMIGVPG
jgi:UDP-glucose 4-epimerase